MCVKRLKTILRDNYFTMLKLYLNHSYQQHDFLIKGSPCTLLFLRFILLKCKKFRWYTGELLTGKPSLNAVDALPQCLIFKRYQY